MMVFFALFPERTKCDIRPESSANLVSHSSSWPSAAYAVPEVDPVDEHSIYWRDELGRLWMRSAHNPRNWHLYLKGNLSEADTVWEEPG